MGPLVLMAAVLAASAPSRSNDPIERGISLGLFSADPSYDYDGLLDEIVAQGATHVSITWVWWQDGIRSTAIGPVEAWTTPDERVVKTLSQAKARGLHVTAFPILRLSKPGPSEWRGKIAPENEAEWWASYTAFIARAAGLATLGGADRIAVGSELMSREGMRGRWKELIEEVRLSSPALEILYSANWDHFEPVSFWDLVDVAGISAYWELTKSMEPTREELVRAWDPYVAMVERLSRSIGKRVLIAEVGYPSIDGAAAWPWDETRKASVDLEEQRLLYESFSIAWSQRPFVSGVFFWNWFGFGGPEDRSYSPRNKPAALELRRFFEAAGRR